MADAEASDAHEASPGAFGLEDLFGLSVDLLCVATVPGLFTRVNPAFERTLGYSAAELVGRPVWDFVHPEDLERTQVAIEVLGRGEELHQFENRYICRDGSVRWLQWNARPGPAEGFVAAAARDVTDSRERKEQAALRRVATLVAHSAAPSDVFSAVAAEAASVLESDYSLVGRFESDAVLTHVATHPPELLSSLGPRTASDGVDLASVVRRTGRPACTNYDEAPGPIAALARALGVRCGVGAPILVDDRMWGVMAAGWSQPGKATSEAAERAAEFTELVAIAISNTESRAALVASRARVVAASDDIRRRIERDLHDGAQQGLVTLALKLRSLAVTIPAEAPDLDAGISEIASGLERVVDELRELSRGIHPAVLSRGGLGPALKALARRALIAVEVDVQLPARPPERIEVAAYYVVAEALTNVAKHAMASVVVVRVEECDGLVCVSVDDDGIGGADPSRGSGLVGLRDRVETLGGSLSVASPPGKGTSLVVQFPATPD
jgi:PAS domain S-box-containing protein